MVCFSVGDVIGPLGVIADGGGSYPDVDDYVMGTDQLPYLVVEAGSVIVTECRPGMGDVCGGYRVVAVDWDDVGESQVGGGRVVIDSGAEDE